MARKESSSSSDEDKQQQKSQQNRTSRKKSSPHFYFPGSTDDPLDQPDPSMPDNNIHPADLEGLDNYDDDDEKKFSTDDHHHQKHDNNNNTLNGFRNQEKTSAKNSRRRVPTKRSASHNKNFVWDQIEKFTPEWISSNLRWKKIRIVVRCSISAWIGLLFMLIDPVRNVIGQASFLILIVSFVAPPCEPMASTIHNYIVILLIVGFAWAWACLGLRIAHITRSDYKFTQDEFAQYYSQLHPEIPQSDLMSAMQSSMYNGDYIETGSSIACAVFYSVGCAMFMWARQWIGPGPYIPGFIFSTIILSIMLTYGPLFPYEFYSIGKTFYIPLALQLAVGIACSCLIFPQTMAHKFVDNLLGVVGPLRDVFAKQSDVLGEDPTSEEWQSFAPKTKATMGQLSRALAMLGAEEALLAREFSIKRLAAKDIKKLMDHARRLMARTSAIVMWFETIARTHRDREDDQANGMDQFILRYAKDWDIPSPSPSRPNSRPTSRRSSVIDLHSQTAHSRPSSRPPSRPPSVRTNTHDGVTSVSPPRTPPTTTISFPQEESEDESHLRPTRKSKSVASSLNSYKGEDNEDEGHQQQHKNHNKKHRDFSLLRKSMQMTHPHPHPHNHSHHHSHSSHSHSPLHQHHNQRSKRFGSHHSIHSMFHDVFKSHKRDRKPVAVHEAQRYMIIENKLSSPSDQKSLAEVLDLLHESSQELHDEVVNSLDYLVDIMTHMKRNALFQLFKSTEKAWGHKISESKEHVQRLKDAIEEFKKNKRKNILQPYLSMFDPTCDISDYDEEPSQRALYAGFQYQHSIVFFANAVLDFLETIVALEEKRTHNRFWTPIHAFISSYRNTMGAKDDFDDDDPDHIPGLDSVLPTPRDPDHLPPSHFGHVIGYSVHRVVHFFSKPQMIWVYEVAILTLLTSLPAFLRSSASFYYYQRGMWATIMAVLTFARFVGETISNFVIRVFGSFVGAIIGMVIWYIGNGNGNGNAYGMAAICAVSFFCLMAYRLWSVPPVTAILTIVTTMLVIGYSWGDTHTPSMAANVGHGWSVAWRRFLLVVIGVTAAFIWSFLPPRLTHKAALRKIYARSIEEIGGLFCQLLTFSNTGQLAGKIYVPKKIFKNWTALRTKLKSTAIRKTFITFELSLRGPWPFKTYELICDLLLEIVDLIAQLGNLMANMDVEWTNAFLKRCHFDDPQYLAELTSVFSMLSTSLKTGAPLPKLHTPLAEHFYKGIYSSKLSTTVEDASLPKNIDLDVLESEEFQRYSVAIQCASAIIIRLDRLTFAVKSLVGETYYIAGVKDGATEEEEALLLNLNNRRDSFDSLA